VQEQLDNLLLSVVLRGAVEIEKAIWEFVVEAKIGYLKIRLSSLDYCDL